MENSRFYHARNYCEFSIARNKFIDSHNYFTDFGFVLPHIGYIEKGSVLLFFEDFCVSASDGDVIFIPAGTPYRSEWKGSPEIEMYVLECDVEFWERYAVPAQKIFLPELSESFSKLYKNVSSEKNYSSLSFFYHIIDKITNALEYERRDNAKATQKALSYIENNVSESFSVKELSRLCNLSESRFFAVFKKENGFSPIDYKNYVRIKHAVQYIKRDKLSVEEICSRLNFSSTAFFRRILKKYTGKTPSQIKKETSI